MGGSPWAKPRSAQRLEEAGSWAARRAAGPSEMGRRGHARQDRGWVNAGAAHSCSETDEAAKA